MYRADNTPILGDGQSAILVPGGLLVDPFDDPDGIAVDPHTGDLIVTSSSQHVIARVRQ